MEGCLAGGPSLVRELAQVREDRQAPQGAAKVAARSCGEDALRPGCELVDRQAAADVMVAEGRCRPFALTVTREHAAVVARGGTGSPALRRAGGAPRPPARRSPRARAARA